MFTVQMPVVLLPLDFDRAEEQPSVKRSVCLRPFLTKDFMTGTAALPPNDLHQQVSAH